MYVFTHISIQAYKYVYTNMCVNIFKSLTSLIQDTVFSYLPGIISQGVHSTIYPVSEDLSQGQHYVIHFDYNIRLLYLNRTSKLWSSETSSTFSPADASVCVCEGEYYFGSEGANSFENLHPLPLPRWFWHLDVQQTKRREKHFFLEAAKDWFPFLSTAQCT